MEGKDNPSEKNMPAGIRDTFRAFQGFLKSPSSSIQSIGSINEKLRSFIHLFILEFLIVIGLAAFIAILVRLKVLPEFNNELLYFPKKMHGLPVVLYVTLIAPVVEEFLFRFNLRLFPKYLHLQVILGAACIYVFLELIGDSKTMSIVALSLSLSFLIFYFTRRRELNIVTESVWGNKFRVVFYITAAIFALAHISKYGLSFKIFLMAPLIVLPQFVMGLFAGYTRLRLGFGWSCLFHSCHNMLVVLPFITAGVIAKTERYNFIIEENDKSSIFREQKMTPDTIVFEGMLIQDILPVLLLTSDNNVEFEDMEFAKKRITLKFERPHHKGRLVRIPSNQIAISEILKHYNLEMKKKTIQSDIYELRIIDSIKLYQYKISDTVDTNTYYTDYPNNQLRLNNARFWQIARSLESKYKERIKPSTLNEDIFTVTIPDLKFNELNQFFLEKYGIYLENIPGTKTVYYFRKK